AARIHGNQRAGHGRVSESVEHIAFDRLRGESPGGQEHEHSEFHCGLPGFWQPTVMLIGSSPAYGDSKPSLSTSRAPCRIDITGGVICPGPASAEMERLYLPVERPCSTNLPSASLVASGCRQPSGPLFCAVICSGAGAQPSRKVTVPEMSRSGASVRSKLSTSPSPTSIGRINPKSSFWLPPKAPVDASRESAISTYLPGRTSSSR